MSIRIITVGKAKDDYIREGIDEYRKRIAPWQNTEIIRIKESNSCASVEKAVEEEGRHILKVIRPGSYIIVLTPEGGTFTSESLARKIEQLLCTGRNRLEIIIGGHEGLSSDVKKRADLLLSLSGLTFSSRLAHLVLMEQLFRCMKIIRREPYHR